MSDEEDTLNNPVESCSDDNSEDDESIPEINNRSENNSSSAEVEEFNDSNHTEDSSEGRISSAFLNGSASTETVESSSSEAESSDSEDSSFLSDLMTDIINERILELLDMPEVTNVIQHHYKNMPQPDSSSKN